MKKTEEQQEPVSVTLPSADDLDAVASDPAYQDIVEVNEDDDPLHPVHVELNALWDAIDGMDTAHILLLDKLKEITDRLDAFNERETTRKDTRVLRHI